MCGRLLIFLWFGGISTQEKWRSGHAIAILQHEMKGSGSHGLNLPPDAICVIQISTGDVLIGR